MKQFATVSFLFTILLISNIAIAQLSFYGVDATLDEDGKTKVKMTLTFSQVEANLKFNVIGRIENFNATSIAGPVSCITEIKSTSFINCNITTTPDKRTIDISFETKDFVISLGERFRFSGDFSLNKDTSQLFVSVRLPEGMALVKDDIPGKLTFPEQASIISNGNIIVWTLTNLRKDQILKFEILYERLPAPFWMQFRLRQIAIFGVAFAAVLGFILIRHFRTSEKLVLSVLDDFEKKVIDVIQTEGGVVNQKKVVLATNLSKAKVSRVVKILVERGLVEAERLGRTNRLKLIKKKLQI